MEQGFTFMWKVEGAGTSGEISYSPYYNKEILIKFKLIPFYKINLIY